MQIVKKTVENVDSKKTVENVDSDNNSRKWQIVTTTVENGR